jgi:hypothetical protein
MRSHAEFLPNGIRGLEHFRRRLFRTTIAKLTDPARPCLDCDLVWTTTLPRGELLGVIEREGIGIGVKKTEPEI